MLYLLVALSMFIVIGCSSNRTDAKSEAPSEAELIARRPECDLLQRYPESMEEIRAKPSFIRGVRVDSCFFALADTLAADYLTTGDTRYMQCLDAICSESDGFVSEYMSEVAGRIYMNRPVDMVKYMHASNTYEGNGIEQSLIYGLRGEIHWPSSSMEPEIDSVTTTLANSELISKEEKDYLKRLDAQWHSKGENE